MLTPDSAYTLLHCLFRQYRPVQATLSSHMHWESMYTSSRADCTCMTCRCTRRYLCPESSMS